MPKEPLSGGGPGDQRGAPGPEGPGTSKEFSSPDRNRPQSPGVRGTGEGIDFEQEDTGPGQLPKQPTGLGGRSGLPKRTGVPKIREGQQREGKDSPPGGAHVPAEDGRDEKEKAREVGSRGAQSATQEIDGEDPVGATPRQEEEQRGAPPQPATISDEAEKGSEVVEREIPLEGGDLGTRHAEGASPVVEPESAESPLPADEADSARPSSTTTSNIEPHADPVEKGHEEATRADGEGRTIDVRPVPDEKVDVEDHHHLDTHATEDVGAAKVDIERVQPLTRDEQRAAGLIKEIDVYLENQGPGMPEHVIKAFEEDLNAGSHTTIGVEGGVIDVGEDTRERYRKLILTNATAAGNVGQISLERFLAGGTPTYAFSQPHAEGGFNFSALQRYNPNELIPREKALYILPGTVKYSITMDSGIKVMTTEHFEYLDPKGKLKNATLRVALFYEIPVGDGSEMRLVKMSGTWTDRDGKPDQEAKDFSIRQFLEEDRSVVSLMTRPDEEVEEAILLRSADRQASLFKASQQETPATTRKNPAPEVLGAIDEYARSEREEEVQEAREKLFFEVAKLIKESPDKNNTAKISEPLINMLELAYKTTNFKPDFNTANDEASELFKYARYKLLKRIFELPISLQVRTFFIEGKLFGNEFILGYLEKQLADERDEIIQSQGLFSEHFANGENSKLETVVKECERLGLDPNQWIDMYGGNAVNKWQLYARHYQRLSSAGRDVSDSIDAHNKKFLTNTEFSNQFVYENIAHALTLSTNADQRKKLIERFIEIQSYINVTFENFDIFVKVGLIALKDMDFETREEFDGIVKRTADEVIENVVLTERDEATTNVEKQKYKWNIRYLASSGENPTSLIVYIEENNDRYQIAQDTALNLAAEQYIANGDFAAANIIIRTMSFQMQMEAYVKAWGSLKSTEELAQLTPPEEPLTGEIDPQLSVHYETAQALNSQNPGRIKRRALALVQAFRKLSSEIGNDFSLLGDLDLHRQQVEQLLQRAESIGGKELGLLYSRAILSLFNGADPTFLDRNLQEALFTRFAKTGKASDAEYIQYFITHQSRETEELPEVIATLTEFGLHIE